MEDLEDLLSQNNIILDPATNEVKVVKKRKLPDGFQATVDIQRIKVPKLIANLPSKSSVEEKILNTLCLSIEDVKRAKVEKNYWRVFNLSYRKVLLYGIAVVENKFTKNGDSMYTISLDDETGVIKGTYKEFDKNVETKEKALLAREINLLEQRRETGFNLHGNYIPASTEDGQFLVNCASNLQKMIQKNFKQRHKTFQQGPIEEKVLVYAKPFTFHDEIRLHIIDLNPCDEIELTWKRNLNQKYLSQYLK